MSAHKASNAGESRTSKRDSGRDAKHRRLILLGSTGSIGVNCLKVVEHLQSRGLYEFEIAGIAAGNNVELLEQQARQFSVKHAAVAGNADQTSLRQFARMYKGPNAARELVEAIAQPGDLVVGAMVGSAGIPATLAAIDKGCDIALANKETLVAAGALVMPRIQAKDVKLIPIDSEHSAIFQCVLSGRSIDEVKRLVITASGGPFRAWSRDRIYNATVEEALNHPTWKMGPKVTIDSASLMNKALEIIEAHWLFGLPSSQIDAIVHPQSLIHSFVEFVDNSVISQLSPPDMKTPIQYALTWPDRFEGCSRTVDWTTLNRMDFEPVDHERFGSVKLAYEVIDRGGTAGAIFNAANEIAVQAFIDRKIKFGRITELVHDALSSIQVTSVNTLDDVMRTDREAREFVAGRLLKESEIRLRRPALSSAQS